jgi:pimeloyl-ACP methyl ester carboxylesterase
MPTFSYDGHKIAYEQRGRKEGSAERPIVLIHGLLLPRKHHYGLASALADRGNRVILIDLLGHGESDRPAHSRFYSMEIFARQVIALLDHLDIQEAVVGGTSLGANVALEAAHHAPRRIRGLFIEMPVLERAAPAAGILFLPLTIAFAEGAAVLQAVANFFKRIPRGLGLYPDVLLVRGRRDPYPFHEDLGLMITRGRDGIIRFDLAAAYDCCVEYHPDGTQPSAYTSGFGNPSPPVASVFKLKENWYLVRYAGS